MDTEDYDTNRKKARETLGRHWSRLACFLKTFKSEDKSRRRQRRMLTREANLDTPITPLLTFKRIISMKIIAFASLLAVMLHTANASLAFYAMGALSQRTSVACCTSCVV